jgi:hypothetical protein
VIIPKQDAATFYTFIPTDPLLQIDWEKIYKFKTGAATIDATSGFLSDRTPYKKWTPLALEGFDNSTYVIVAGSHIKETENQPTISLIACQPGNNNTIDLSKFKASDTVSCTVKGTDLELITQLILETTTDSKDQVKATSVAVNNGDTTQATASFDAASLKGTSYKVFYAVKGGTPQSTTQTLTVQQPPAAASAPTATVSPASLTFSSQKMNTKSAALDITLTNSGNGPLTMTSITLTGANATDYVLTNTCGTSVAASGDCKIRVSFAPNAKGSRTASVTITDNSKDSPQTVTLSGTGK